MTYKFKKNGFSLVELLTAFVILGVLSGAAIFGVNRFLKKARVKYYKTQEKIILSAGKEYFVDNKNSLPREIGKSTKIQLSKLTTGEYIDDVKDYNKKNCDMSKSYITVKKETISGYSYNVYLNCPSDNYSNNTSSKAGNANIIINLNTSVKNDPKANVSITDSNGIASYNYIIYRNGKEVKNSGNINNANKTTNYNFTVPFKGLGDGKYTIKVTSIDEYGNETFKTSTTNVMIDTTGPKCGTITGASTNWTNSNRTLSITCSDDVSGCVKSSYSQTFSTTTKIGKITLTDNYGNKTNCSVNTYVDKDKPTCGDNNGTTSWTAVNRTVKLKCNDKGSGCNQDSYTQTFTTTTKVFNYTIIDKAGNTTSCPVNIYVDKTPPKCTTSTNHSGWTNQDVTLTGTCSGEDNQSGCKGNITKKFSAEGSHNDTPGIIYDKVGNSTQCGTVSVKIDKTAPTCKTTTNHTDWTNQKVTITGTCSDSASGCSGNVSKSFDSEMNTGKSPGTVYDNAGNSKSCSNILVQIDKTAPGCTTTSNRKGWTNTNVTITGTCSDGASGCKGNTSKYFDYEMNESKSPGIVYDKAGNSKSCSNILVQIDKTAPKCTTSSDHSSWTKDKVTLTGTCTDSLSKCKGNTSASFDYEIYADKSPGTVYDNAGNSATCGTKKVQIDRTAPKCTTISDHSGWTKDKVTLTGTCTDSDSKCTGNTSASFDYEIDADKSPGTVYDNAGNSATCGTKKVQIDKTGPVISNIKNSSGNHWTNQNITLSFDTADAHNGVSKTVYAYKDSVEHTDWGVGSTNTKTFGTWSAERCEEVWARAYDGLGNVSGWSYLGWVCIDKTGPGKPSIKLKYDSDTGGDYNQDWTRNNIYGRADSSDSASGISYYQYSTDNGSTWSGSFSNSSYVSKDNKNAFQWITATDKDVSVKVRAVDNAGNAGTESDSFTLRRDTIAYVPVITLVRAKWINCHGDGETNQYIRGHNVTCDIEAQLNWDFNTVRNDPGGSGVSTVYHKFNGYGDSCSQQDDNPWGVWQTNANFKFNNCSTGKWQMYQVDNVGNESDNLVLNITYVSNDSGL